MNYYNYDQIDFTGSQVERLKAELEQAKNELYYKQIPYNKISMFNCADRLRQLVKEKEKEYKEIEQNWKDFQAWEKSLGYLWYEKIKTYEECLAFAQEQLAIHQDKPHVVQALSWWSEEWRKAHEQEQKYKKVCKTIQNQITELKIKRGLTE